MTRGFTVSPRARQDLRDVWDSIAVQQQSPAVADRLLDRLRSAFSILATQPILGEARPDLGNGLRALVAETYVVLYAHETGRVEIVRVVHSARDLAALFRRQEP